MLTCPDAGRAYHRLYWWDGANEIAADRCFIPVSGRVPESRSALLKYPMASTSCVAFRRTALDKLLPVPVALRSQADAFLTALVLFIALVIAVTDYLGRYRLHATNLFQTTAAKPSRQQIQHRIAMRAALLTEIQKWLSRNGYNPRSADLRAYLVQGHKAQEQDAFVLDAPRRWKYFRHLLGYPWTYGEIMTTRHCVYSYLRACAALVLGYHHVHLFDDARRNGKEWLVSSSKKTLVAVKAKAAAATKS